MPFSFETFAWAVSALFQLLTVCAYLLSFPDVDGVDDQLPDMPEVIQDSAIEMKITYSGIIFVFGFYTQVVVVKQRWNWWRKKMEEPDNSLMVMVGVYVHNLICNFFQVSHASMVFSSNLGTWLRKASRTTCGPPFFLASVFLVGICIVAGLGFFSDTWTSFLVLREKVRARMKEQEDATTETATNAETVTPADASPADAPPVAESKASEPTVGADSSGGVKEADVMEEEGIETVGDLARVDVDNRDLAMAVTGASQYNNARTTLWRWKGAAADLLEVELADKPPPMEKHAERPAKHQHVPDGVENRFVAWLIGRFSHRSSIRLIAG